MKLWGEANHVLLLLSKGETKSWRGLISICDSCLYLPNSARMNYHLYWNEERRSWMRKRRGGFQKIWGGVVVQNVMEALARVDLSQGMLRIEKATGIRPVGTVHDEVWYLWPRSEADALHALAVAELSRSPAWLPGIPIAVEGHLGERYEKA